MEDLGQPILPRLPVRKPKARSVPNLCQQKSP